MTARYNVFKDSTTQCEAPSNSGTFVGVAQSQEQSRLGKLPGTRQHFPHSVDNVANVRRGHDVSNGEKS